MKAKYNRTIRENKSIPAQAKAEALSRNIYFTPPYMWRASYAIPVAILAALAMVVARIVL